MFNKLYFFVQWLDNLKMKRHQLSGHQKRQKKLKAVEEEKLQMGSLHKFFGKKTLIVLTLGFLMKMQILGKNLKMRRHMLNLSKRLKLKNHKFRTLKILLLQMMRKRLRKKIQLIGSIMILELGRTLING